MVLPPRSDLENPPLPAADAGSGSAPLALHLPLHGSRLIEASAGTGKTWTIASLYVRLVLGPVPGRQDAAGQGPDYHRPLLPAEILVVTFTRAATQELAARIRARLTEAARCFRSDDATSGQPLPGDDFLCTLRGLYPPGPLRQQAAWRLEMAAQSMDQAAIDTLDAWCLKVLQGNASLTGSLAGADIGDETHALWRLAALDFWRNHVAGLELAQLQEVQKIWADGDKWLVKSQKWQSHRPSGNGGVDTSGTSLADCIGRARQRIDSELGALVEGWVEKIVTMTAWLEQQLDLDGRNKQHWDGRKLKLPTCRGWLGALRAWVQNPEVGKIAGWSDTATTRLQPQGLLESRKASAPEMSLQDIPAPFAELPGLIERQAALCGVEREITGYAFAYTHARWQWLKTSRHMMDFNDLLLRVQQALAGPHAAALRQRLLAQYPVALIDEFQDTSPGQYALLNTLYQPEQNEAEHLLLLIGDPKQAIYGFRGADINSYLRARRTTAGRHYMLDVNFRSTADMVAAVNHVFAAAEAREPGGAFRFGGGGENPLPFHAVRANGLAERLCDRDGRPVPALTLGVQDQLQTRDECEAFFARHCAEQIALWLQPQGLQMQGVAPQETTSRALSPGDIAVLVRNRNEARRMQQALRQRQLQAVFLSDRESVFASAQAQDLARWLQAVAQPDNVRLARTAFATGMLGLPLEVLRSAAGHDDLLGVQLELLQSLQRVWQEQGVLAMLHQTIYRLGLARRWLGDAAPQGERTLTNLLHLGELLQDASGGIEGEQGLIRFLLGEIERAAQDQGAMEQAEQTVRLESDARLIQIVTVHKSKGLEYPLVVLPFASSARLSGGKSTGLPDSEADDAPGDETGQDDRQQDEENRLREDVRLLYVALTRARHAVWAGFGLYGTEKKVELQRTALGYLLQGDGERSPAGWIGLLPALAAGGDERLPLQVCVLQTQQPIAVTPCQPQQEEPQWLAARDYPVRLERRYAIASFSALARAGSGHGRPVPQGVLRHAGELAQPFMWTRPERGASDEAPELPAMAAQPQPVADEVAGWHGLRGGADLGDWVHQALQWLQEENFAPQWSEQQQLRLVRQAEVAGMQEQLPVLLAWLQRIMTVPLPLSDVALPLGALDRTLAEMEFWLPVQQGDTRAIDLACTRHCWSQARRAPLNGRQWQGMVMGFADLVFEHGGRYWVLDYKTNRLGEGPASYNPPDLQQAMLAHRYDLQAALYLYALHRHLRNRLADYSVATHLGGALYWFLRGVDQPGAGLLHMPASEALLNELDAAFGQAQEAHHAD